MVSLSDLEAKGWSISADGLEHLKSELEDEFDLQDVIDLALDTDLKLIGKALLKI